MVMKEEALITLGAWQFFVLDVAARCAAFHADNWAAN